MSDLANWYCRSYIITPIVEACRKRGIFEALDVRVFRQRNRLIGELKANVGYFTIALEALESSGWLEKNDNDAFRLTLKAENYQYRDLSFLYASEPDQIIHDRSGA